MVDGGGRREVRPRRISVVLPVYNEAANIQACLRGLAAALEGVEHEILVCYDFEEDSTLPAIAAMEDAPKTLRLVRNDSGRGAANALRAGFRAATGDVVVTTMADLSDPPEVIPVMAEHLRQGGYAVVAGSRYMRGGSQRGGPWLKQAMSRAAGLALRWIGGLGTHDATTNFRAYSRSYLDSVGIESERGFEIALELTVKAQQRGLRVGEVPSSWTDRSAGESRFQVWAWLPNYLRWWLGALREPLLVWGTWLGLVTGAVVFIATYGSQIPFLDDLEILRLWMPTPERSLHGLWALHNEHRIPIPRLIQAGLLELTWDIRSGMYAQVVIHGAVSAAMILVARRLRGRTSWTDAFFPLIWLHIGNSNNLLMGWQISLALPTALALTWVLSTLLLRDTLSLGRAVLLSLLPVMLPLCGGPGIGQAPAVLAGNLLLIALVATKRLRASRAAVPVLALGIVVTVAILVAYFQGFRYPDGTSKTRDPVAILDVAARFWALNLGNAGRAWWPWSAWGILAVGTAALVLLLRRLRGPVIPTVQVLALLVGIAGALLVGGAVGHGRGGAGWPSVGFAQRYIGLPAGLLCSVYFAFMLFGGRLASALVRGSLAVALCAAVIWVEVPEGLRYGEERQRHSQKLEQDILSGMQPYEVFRRNGAVVYPQSSGFIYLLGLWLRHRLPPFERIDANSLDSWINNPFKARIASIEHGVGHVRLRRVREGFDAMLAPPHSAIRLGTGPEIQALTGMYSVMAAATMFGDPSPLRFVVELEDESGRTVLLDRVLDPAREAEHRGPQALKLELQPRGAGQVVLRVLPTGPEAENHAWGYWAAVEVF
ncbi:MAG: glycosyltransferase [Planctomycetes bacterium]|nr:glycosyltransferase [Planctomycetota bacterium]